MGRAMLPPPAPMVTMSSIGSCNGNPPIWRSTVISGSLSRTRHMSALVPPTSIEMKLGEPAAFATCSAPMTPATGPERTVWIACRAAMSALVTPPLDFMMNSGAFSPLSAAADSSPARYRPTRGMT